MKIEQKSRKEMKMAKKELKNEAPKFEIVTEEVSVIDNLIKNKALRLLPVVSKFVEALKKIAQELKSLRDELESLKSGTQSKGK